MENDSSINKLAQIKTSHKKPYDISKYSNNGTSKYLHCTCEHTEIFMVFINRCRLKRDSVSRDSVVENQLFVSLEAFKTLARYDLGKYLLPEVN